MGTQVYTSYKCAAIIYILEMIQAKAVLETSGRASWTAAEGTLGLSREAPESNSSRVLYLTISNRSKSMKNHHPLLLAHYFQLLFQQLH